MDNCVLCGGKDNLVSFTMQVVLCKKDVEMVKANPFLLLALKDKVEISQIELAQEKV